MSLRTFMRLPPLQRSAVILKDVLDHSLDEVSSITGASEAAATSALQRGRVRLREFGNEPADISPPMLTGASRVLLIRYVTGFQTGDFDAVRAMLVYDREVSLDTPAYFVALAFNGDQVVSIHDFLYARYAMEGLEPAHLAPRDHGLARRGVTERSRSARRASTSARADGIPSRPR
jgi:RNA polymerase sigma-70 factor (ECF subfamily)